MTTDPALQVASPLWLILEKIWVEHQFKAGLPSPEGFETSSCSCGSTIVRRAGGWSNHVMFMVYDAIGRTLGDASVEYRAEALEVPLNDWEERSASAIEAGKGAAGLELLQKLLRRDPSGLVGAYRLTFTGEWTRVRD